MTAAGRAEKELSESEVTKEDGVGVAASPLLSFYLSLSHRPNPRLESLFTDYRAVGDEFFITIFV